MTQDTLIEEQQKSIDHLQAYAFEIIYKTGKNNTIADALFRQGEPPTFNSILIIEPSSVQGLLVDFIMGPNTIQLQQCIIRGKKS